MTFPGLLLLGVLLGTAATAADRGREDLPPFDQVDTNQDGWIDRSEAATIEGLDFELADANDDGHIDRSEYLAEANDPARQ